MSVFTRFRDIVSANINSLLDKAEDPEKMLKLMIQEMEDTIIDLKVSCSAKMAEKIRTNDSLKEINSQITRWENRAHMAIEKGKDDLAREALLEKRKALEKESRLKEYSLTLSEDIKVRKEEIATLEEKIDQAKTKLKILQDREQNAQFQRDKQNHMNRHFENFEERINRMNEYNSFDKQKENVEEKFSKFERDEEIEKELEKLKKEAKEKK